VIDEKAVSVNVHDGRDADAAEEELLAGEVFAIAAYVGGEFACALVFAPGLELADLGLFDAEAGFVERSTAEEIALAVFHGDDKIRRYG